MMDLNALLDALGYLHSDRHWVTPENADPRLAHYYRLAQRAGEEAGNGAAVVGSYVYTTSLDDRATPPRPAVFVSYAHDDEQARNIHRRFWNMGDCPFVVVVLPDSIRVYTGFDYSHTNPKHALIVDEPASLLDDNLPESLRQFHAQEIDSGTIWEKQAKRLTSDTRVDYRLLANLKELSIRLQTSFGLARAVAHALIGKYIYFRYLRDRAILDDGWLAMKGLRPQDVFGREATAAGFDALAQALQVQFNGAIFPLPSDDDGQWRTNDAIRFLAATFHGDDFEGQLVLDFGAYDFSYIPIELLSSVYEQFLKAEGKGEGDGVVYTPEPLADYLLAEMEAVHPLQLSHRVLDPCCGSGVFLVLAYRRLIEKIWQQAERPSAETLKRLLQTNIFGVEKDPEACDITAFSLILTLLSHLEPPELHANADFQFPTLVGENIHRADFFDPECGIFREKTKFDWIVGNPPWASADEKNPNHALAIAWMREAAKQGRTVGEKRLDEAFTWRAGDLLHSEGCAGLLVKATTLVNSTSAAYRKAFFKTYEVRRISNLSNLRYVLFTGPEGQRAKAPCACLVYGKTVPDAPKSSILHFGPFVVDQLPVRTKAGRRRAWTITLYENDIQQIDATEAEDDTPCLWKTALWGSYQDRRALRRLSTSLPLPLGTLADQRHWSIGQGTKIKRDSNRPTNMVFALPELIGQSLLKKKRDLGLSIIKDDLEVISEARALVTRKDGLNIISAPHTVIFSTGAAYSDLNFVVPSPCVGITVPQDDAKYLKAVTLFLNSSVGRYLSFFYNAPSGIYVASPIVFDVRAMPFKELSGEQLRELGLAYDKFAQQEKLSRQREAPLDMQSEIDALIERVLELPKSACALAQEFVQVRSQLGEGKTGASASESPSIAALQLYATELREMMDDFARRHHQVTISVGTDAILATVGVTNASEVLPVEVSREWNASARRILSAANEQHSQWAYIQRSVRIFEGPRVHIIKANRLLDWTRTQAVQDTADLVAEVLDKTAPSYERATA
jgi:hypothetical protein